MMITNKYLAFFIAIGLANIALPVAALVPVGDCYTTSTNCGGDNHKTVNGDPKTYANLLGLCQSFKPSHTVQKICADKNCVRACNPHVTKAGTCIPNTSSIQCVTFLLDIMQALRHYFALPLKRLAMLATAHATISLTNLVLFAAEADGAALSKDMVYHPPKASNGSKGLRDMGYCYPTNDRCRLVNTYPVFGRLDDPVRLDDCLSFSPSYHIILKCLDSECTKGCKKEDVKGLSCLEYSAKIRCIREERYDAEEEGKLAIEGREDGDDVTGQQ